MSIERRGNKKKLQDKYQKFDPTSIFDDVEETAGNFLGQVVEVGENPKVRLYSHAFGNERRDVSIKFRKKSGSAGDSHEAQRSFFKPGARNEPRQETPPEQRLKTGDIVEMQSCYIQDSGKLLCPWNFHKVADKSSALDNLLLPEIPSCLISRAKIDEPTKREYQVISAARGEAKQITGFLDNLSFLKQHLDYQIPMVNGFILRGPIKPGQKVWQGLTCVKTLADIEEGRTSEQVIFNFLKNKGHGIVDRISEDSPWEVIPLYVGRPSASVRERLDQSFHHKHFMSFGLLASTELKFVHCNIVISPTQEGAPVVKHFNLCRAKPLQLDASVPNRAIEKKIKEMSAELVPA